MSMKRTLNIGRLVALVMPTGPGWRKRSSSSTPKVLRLIQGDLELSGGCRFEMLGLKLLRSALSYNFVVHQMVDFMWNPAGTPNTRQHIIYYIFSGL